MSTPAIDPPNRELSFGKLRNGLRISRRCLECRLEDRTMLKVFWESAVISRMNWSHMSFQRCWTESSSWVSKLTFTFRLSNATWRCHHQEEWLCMSYGKADLFLSTRLLKVRAHCSFRRWQWALFLVLFLPSGDTWFRSRSFCLWSPTYMPPLLTPGVVGV